LSYVVSFLAGLSPNAISTFIGCGGMLAIGKLLRDVDKKNCNCLSSLLDTIIRIFTIDDQKPNSDLRRSFVRANVSGDALNVAKDHFKKSSKESIEICNKVGQLFQMLSRRDDAYVRRALTSYETVRAMLDIIKSHPHTKLKSGDSKDRKPSNQTIRRDLLKSMRFICSSESSNANNLAKAGAIKVFVSEYAKSPDLQVHILAILSRCCKFDKECMEEAVKEGIIPHLLKTGTDRFLKEDIVPLFTAMTKWPFASKAMLDCGVVQYFVDLLHDRFYLDSALNALDIWAKKEKKNVSRPLAVPKTVKSITWAIENGGNEQVLEHLKNLLEGSKTLSKAMVKDGEIVPILLSKLKSPRTSAQVKLKSLLVLRRLCEFDNVKPKSSLASKYKLVSELTTVRKEHIPSELVACIKAIDEILNMLVANTSSHEKEKK